MKVIVCKNTCLCRVLRENELRQRHSHSCTFHRCR